MNLKWYRADIYSFLYNEDDSSTILSIINIGDNKYVVNLACIGEQYHITADSMDIAEWHAVTGLSALCNKKANYYHGIRDNLPSIKELAIKAKII